MRLLTRPNLETIIRSLHDKEKVEVMSHPRLFKPDTSRVRELYDRLTAWHNKRAT